MSIFVVKCRIKRITDYPEQSNYVIFLSSKKKAPILSLGRDNRILWGHDVLENPELKRVYHKAHSNCDVIQHYDNKS